MAADVSMRDFIIAADVLLTEEEDMIVEVDTPVASATALIEDLRDVVERLRSFMEAEDGEFAHGVESGMQRAADMIENAIRRHTEAGDGGQ